MLISNLVDKKSWKRQPLPPYHHSSESDFSIPSDVEDDFSVPSDATTESHSDSD